MTRSTLTSTTSRLLHLHLHLHGNGVKPPISTPTRTPTRTPIPIPTLKSISPQSKSKSKSKSQFIRPSITIPSQSQSRSYLFLKQQQQQHFSFHFPSSFAKFHTSSSSSSYQLLSKKKSSLKQNLTHSSTSTSTSSTHSSSNHSSSNNFSTSIASPSSKRQKKKNQPQTQTQIQPQIQTQIQNQNFDINGEGVGVGGKGGRFESDGEDFDMKQVKKKMEVWVEGLSGKLKSVVGLVEGGGANARMLDTIRVTIEEEGGGKGESYPLRDFANVSIKDSKTLIVNVYSSDTTKNVETAIYNSPIGITPFVIDDSTIRIPIPSPTYDRRRSLSSEASSLCEFSRNGIRQCRHEGREMVKKNVRENKLTKDDERGVFKELDDLTKKKTQQIDEIAAKAHKTIMDE